MPPPLQLPAALALVAALALACGAPEPEPESGRLSAFRTLAREAVDATDANGDPARLTALEELLRDPGGICPGCSWKLSYRRGAGTPHFVAVLSDGEGASRGTIEIYSREAEGVEDAERLAGERWNGLPADRLDGGHFIVWGDGLEVRALPGAAPVEQGLDLETLLRCFPVEDLATP